MKRARYRNRRAAERETRGINGAREISNYGRGFEPSRNCFAKVGANFVEGFAFGNAPRQGRHLGPETAFIRRMHDCSQCHDGNLTRHHDKSNPPSYDSIT
jgi:hypothetical protein